MSIFSKLIGYLSTIIQFKDINVKEALLASSDINPDGTREITYVEARNSSITATMLKTALNPNNNNTSIVSFEEFKYFTSLSGLVDNLFKGCVNLKEISFPSAFGANDAVNLLYDTAVEVLHLEGFTQILSRSTSAQNPTSKFGYLPSLKEVWIPDLNTITYVGFSLSHQPNVEKIIISSIEQWLKIQLNQSAYNSLPSASGKASLYLISDLEHPITSITTLSEAIPNVTTVPTVMAFNLAGLKNITNITISAQNTAVAVGAFKDLPNTVVINNFNYISSVAADAFNNCKAQGIETFPSNISAVYENSFRSSSLTKLESNNLLKIHGFNSFRESALTSVKIDNCTLGTGTGYSFFQCRSLVSVSLNSFSGIPTGTFNGCINLEEISCTSATSIGDGSFQNCTKLTTIDGPNIVTINKNAFHTCSALLESNISFNLNELVIIKEAAFANCSNLTCPYDFLNLTEISDNAFSGCKAPTQRYVIFRYQGIVKFNLASVAAQQYSLDTFGSTPQKITTIYVPDGNITIDGVTKTYLQWYQDHSTWSQFISRNNLTLDVISNIPT